MKDLSNDESSADNRNTTRTRFIYISKPFSINNITFTIKEFKKHVAVPIITQPSITALGLCYITPNIRSISLFSLNISSYYLHI